jgi:hypothetical protein
LQSNQVTAVNLRTVQMTTCVQLIEALGGGWDTSQLPTQQQVATEAPPQPAAAQSAPPSDKPQR